LNINNQHSEKKHYGSLSHSLISSYLFLAVVPLIFVLWFSYQQTQKSLNESISAKLTQSSKLSRDFIENWFFYRFADLNSLTESRNNLILLNKLSDGFKKSNDSLKEYVDSFDWTNHVGSNKNILISFGRRYDYVKDLYLIDINGNILYSMERKSDLGRNLFSGNLASSKFSKAVKMTLESGKDIFSDLEYYTPSGNQITGFITSEISNDVGESIGVLAVQLRFDGVFQHFSTVTNIDYLHHYIIEKNGELRTPINENKLNEIFKRKIKTEEYGHIETDPDEENVTHEYLDPNNNRVIGLHKTINIKNIDWILISEINYKEAFLPIDNLLKIQIVLVFFSVVFIVIFAYYYSRRITQPIVMLAQASMDVAMGESNNKVNIKADNEIGQLAESFNHMLYIRKEYERSLIENKVEIKHALENLKYQKFALDQHAIVSISNADGRIIYSNKRFNEISGYSNDELYGKNHRLLKSQVHDDDFFIEMFYELVSGKTWHGEICNKAKNGELYWIDATIVPYLDVKGEPDSYISIATNITLQKQAALELSEAKVIAETAVLAKNEFLASMSHEIRTPMNGVIGMLGLMLNASLSDEQRHRADIAQKSANSLLTVIDDILDFSKIEADKLTLEILDFNLIKMMDEFLEPIALQAHEKNLEIILNVTQINESMIKGDPGRIRQILSNLVSNAIKFTDNGEIVITVSSYEIGLNGLKINILVSDTGVGISEDKIPTLFDYFTQADASITRKYGGTGLGLTIVKKLCKLMGGTVSVSNNQGSGSVFNVSIIVEKSEHSEHVVPRTNISKLKILIVDDSTTNREVLRGQLEYWGASVFEAVSGADAQRVCEERMNHETSEFFNIAFIDMQMPEMNGVSLVESLKKIFRILLM